MRELDHSWLAEHPLPEAGGDIDKNEKGRVLAAGGSRLVPGALLLTGEAALRAGAGKIQLASIEHASLALGVAMPETATFGLEANNQGELGRAAGEALGQLLQRTDALVLGPGMGAKADAAAILEALIACAPKGSVVLDAAMISAARLLEQAPAVWAGKRVLTPHFGEMAALMNCDEKEVSPQLAQLAAKRFDATIVLKASETWIASPDEAMLHYPGGGPGLATAGSGDVLAGIIGGLLARGATPLEAAAWGVWAHGEAGRQLAQRVGALGFLAHELLPVLPSLLCDLQE
jgi:ADP-dependent NAD(P)H-hydrate dehydratase